MVIMKLTSEKQQQGNFYEMLALKFLLDKGLTFVAKNWQYKNMGELDLVMLDNQQKFTCLVVVEVRQRQKTTFVTALDSVTPAKQRKIIQTTQAFLQANEYLANIDVRFDVVVFATDSQQKSGFLSNLPIIVEPVWIQSAFETEG